MKKRQYVLDLSPNHSGQKLTYLEFNRGIEVTIIKDLKNNTALAGSSAKSGIIPDVSTPAKEVHKEPEAPARRSARVRNESQTTHEINPKTALSSRTRSVARAKRQIRKPIQPAIFPRRKRKALPNYEMVDGKRQCPICRKLFSLNSNFGRHIRLHTEGNGHENILCQCNANYLT
ncbi:putative zinc finger protein [Orchesella cincta]|uniref:Putative zinc finger protein n=1 Tax=Orchesella cincta TaxID=48709 RepID=A0A1D2M5R4_ORCCI|nr:putative zinc finger protein [Orchesella cincta]